MAQVLQVHHRTQSNHFQQCQCCCHLLQHAEFCWKVTPALAAGNTVVIKVSKETSLTALLMGDLAAEAGLPPGVLNVLTGPGKSLGDAMVEHPMVDKVWRSIESE
jgi:delta 1-pyrroline-5-carboxylate dehydrogenase